MTLHATVSGAGPRLVLLHGWGLNSRVWKPVLPALNAHFTTVCIDLPGHGESSWPPAFGDIDSLAECIEQSIAEVLGQDEHSDPNVFLLGWSLGSMAAIALAARRPELVKRLVLVTPTPKFVRGEDWAHGVEEQVLDGFAERMRSDVRATIREFMALQVQGDEQAHSALRVLRNEVLAVKEPHAEALGAGLDVLRSTDLRPRLSQVIARTLVISGERDRLTLPAAGAALAERLPDARFHLVKRAAHAPFVSHAGEFCSEVIGFLSENTHLSRSFASHASDAGNDREADAGVKA